MDLDAVRTFVAVADTGRFAAAADDLAVTQQAVSKREATLERELGVRLFTRTARGAQLTSDGQAFLPHARELLQAEQRAAAAVRPGQRALRVDVVGRQLGPAAALRRFHRAHPETLLEVVALSTADVAVAAVQSGTVDAAIRALTIPAWRLPPGLTAARVLDEPIQLLTGPGHALADAAAVRPDELAGHRLWMPSLVSGSEWGAYYDELSAAFGLSIEVTGPEFGSEPLLDTIAGTAELATLIGEQNHLLWPADWDLRRIPVRDPVPVYPHSLIWRIDNPHPGLTMLRVFLGSRRAEQPEAETWTPRWAHDGRSAFS